MPEPDASEPPLHGFLPQPETELELEPVEGEGCYPPGREQSVPNTCEDGPACTAYCILGRWRFVCPACRGPGSCPELPPQAGASCSAGSGPCHFNDCEVTGFLTAECVAGRWALGGELCEYAQCEFGEDGWGRCYEQEACAVGPPWGGLCARAVTHSTGCDDNPCQGKPFSCGCAGALCSPYHRCAEAAGGEATCEPNTDLEGLPVDIAGPENLAAVVDGRLCSAQQCVDPDTGETEDLPEGLESFGGLVQHAGYLYGTNTRVLTRLKIGGSAVETILDERPHSFALDDPYLYWLRRPDGAPAADVMRQKLNGSDQKVLAEGQIDAHHLILDGQTLYWNAPGGHVRMPLASGEPTFVASAWEGQGSVVDGEALWLDDESRQLQRVDLQSGVLRMQAEVQGYTLQVHDRRLYVGAPGPKGVSTLRRYGLDGAPLPDDISVHLLPQQLLFDDRFLYWRGCGGAVRLPK